jgi:oxygen-independent coproporphyrinogen-3 oxidase
VYVHVPFCLHRCRYCGFLSFGQEHAEKPALADYVALLKREVALRGAWAREVYAQRGRVVDSVFFGGGTPTFLPREELAALVEAVRSAFAVAPGAEVTIEANPETLDAPYIAALAQAGVNRLSIGVQAAQDRHLRFLGRTHRWPHVARALECAAAGAIRRLSFDLIYAVPGLTLGELKQTLRQLLALKPEHVSAYELTIEPGTWMWRWARRHLGGVATPAQSIAQQRLVERMLGGAGLYRYEVSNYARPGAECRHNLRYWRGGDYIGLGLGAASRIGTLVVDNPREMQGYARLVAGAGGPEADPLCAAAQQARQDGTDCAPPADAFLRLRTRAGLPLVAARIDPRWIERGWVRPAAGMLEVTSAGLNFADTLARAQDLAWDAGPARGEAAVRRQAGSGI